MSLHEVFVCFIISYSSHLLQNSCQYQSLWGFTGFCRPCSLNCAVSAGLRDDPWLSGARPLTPLTTSQGPATTLSARQHSTAAGFELDAKFHQWKKLVVREIIIITYSKGVITQKNRELQREVRCMKEKKKDKVMSRTSHLCHFVNLSFIFSYSHHASLPLLFFKISLFLPLYHPISFNIMRSLLFSLVLLLHSTVLYPFFFYWNLLFSFCPLCPAQLSVFCSVDWGHWASFVEVCGQCCVTTFGIWGFCKCMGGSNGGVYEEKVRGS